MAKAQIAVQVEGVLFKDLFPFHFDYENPIERTVRRIHQYLEDGFEVVVVDRRMAYGQVETDTLRRNWSTYSAATFGQVLPLEPIPPMNAVLFIGTKVNQMFDGRGVGVDETMAVLLNALEGLAWTAVPKLEPFKPEGAGDTITLTELLDGVLVRI